MNSISKTKVFNQRDKIVEGWYWALPSKQLRRGKALPLRLMGQDLVLYRGESGRAVAMEAYCHHMGAHLAEGKVEGDKIRCAFHYWCYDSTGRCTEIPAKGDCSVVRPLKTWPIEEKYGLIWIWTGEVPQYPVPCVPELEDKEVDFFSGGRFVKNCHPNVVMINAIDEQHFYSVHPLVRKLAGRLQMELIRVNESNARFENVTPIPTGHWATRFLARFYEGPLTYKMSYWFGTTGTVTLGPDFLHFHIIFSLRPTEEGRTEGRTILVTKHRRGALGWLFNRLVLISTKLVGDYFSHGDTKIFQTIHFDLETPIKADKAVVNFIQHVEEQKIANWGFSKSSTEKESRTTLRPLRSSEAAV